MRVVNLISSLLLPLFLLGVLSFGLVKKVPLYHSFIEGGKGGIRIILEIIPPLVAMMVAISVLEASGTIDFIMLLLRPLLSFLGIPVEIMPLAIMRSLSGSGSQALLIHIFEIYGPDSYLGKIASVLFGSTETTFYIITVYFGAVQITKLRHSLTVGLLADLVGLLAAVFFTTLFLG